MRGEPETVRPKGWIEVSVLFEYGLYFIKEKALRVDRLSLKRTIFKKRGGQVCEFVGNFK